MKVTFVGSGGPVVTEKRCCPCLLIDKDILIDCGSGALRNLRLLKVNLLDICYLLISHCHADHIADVVPLLWAMQLDGRRSELIVVGPSGIRNTIHKLLRILNTPEGFLTYDIVIKEVSGSTSLSEISTCSVSHTIPTLAYRVTRGDVSVCYSGDTRFSSDLVKLAENVDLLIHESSFKSSRASLAFLTGHSTASDAGKVARLAKARKLALFHIFREDEIELVEEASANYDGEVIVAEDFLSIEV